MPLLLARAGLVLKPTGLLKSPGIGVNRITLRLSARGISDEVRQAGLKTAVLTVPNVLTMTRIGCTPFICHYILTNNLTPALGLFAYSCVTDFLDGYIARRYKLKSVAGTILDPLADKLLMVATTVSLAFPPGPQLIPLPIAGLILGRDVLLGLSALYFRYASMRHRYSTMSWSSYWDFFHYPSAEVKPTQISKYNTFFQMIYLGSGVILLIFNNKESEKEEEEENDTFRQLSQYFTYMGYLVAATTVLSGGSYVFSKDAVKFLKK